MARKKGGPGEPRAQRAKREPVLPTVNAIIDSPDSVPGLPFTVVAIGASAGGLQALSSMLRALPVDTGMAFVVIQHLEPSHTSLLSEILARETRMPVREVRDGVKVEPNAVYVIPPGKNLVLDEIHLKLAQRTETRGQHRPIDHFMRSLAESQAERSIGVVLSGTATDGTLGLQEIKAAGGITFAQDDSAEHGGMPRSAIASGCVDLVMAPAAIAAEIARIGRHPHLAAVEPEPPPTDEARSIARTLELLRHATGVDFANYKRNTLYRRITRRMALHRLDGLSDYVRKLQQEPAEIEALYQDILINVTSFFRDPASFEALKTQVFPRLAEGRSRHEPVRVWVLGCSTGEEAYSTAMAYSEWAEASGSRVPMQIFATDLNGTGIDKARAGIYPRGIAQDLAPERLRRFFVETDGSYRVAKPLRDMCVFARQNALSDPPFSHMSLVTCRNMLIYLEPVLQQRLLPLLHYALQPRGFLWLGHSEAIGNYRDLFDPVDAQHKIFQRKPGNGRPRALVPLGARLPAAPAAGPAPQPAPRTEGDAQREADRLLLTRYVPPSVVVDKELNVLQFRGDTGPYLAPAPGRPTTNLVKMLREGLLAPLRSALRKSQKDGALVREEGVRVRADGGYRELSLVVMPLRDPGVTDGTKVILFEEHARRAERRARHAEAQARAAADKVPARDRKGVAAEVQRLQDELAEMREFLQTVTEEHETATEELQSANEEVQSTNEELQSTNEELETSREEIQSSNEELATVNDELQRRNEDLLQANNDLNNLIASVQMPIVILGADLRMRRFTPAAEKLLNLIPTDVGRPLADIRLRFDVPGLEPMLLEVIESVTVKELEVQDAQGRWYLLRIRPYKTLDNRIEGVVLVFVDVDTLRQVGKP
jgi:two-component system CheB/CheR fusion protein